MRTQCPKCGYGFDSKPDHVVEEAIGPDRGFAGLPVEYGTATPLPEYSKCAPTCWCGKGLKAVGMPDFIGDKSPDAVCTVHYECGAHGTDYEMPTPQVSAEDTAQVNPVQGIAISGKARSGKSTLADMLVERLGGNWHVESLSEAIIEEFAKMNWYEPDFNARSFDLLIDHINANKEEYRSELIKLGQKRRAEDPDYWIKRISCSPNAIVSNCRFKNEYNYFKSKGFYMVRVEAAPGTREARGCPDLDDPSETELDSIDYKEWDYLVYNDLGFTILGDQADAIAEDIMTRRMENGLTS